MWPIIENRDPAAFIWGGDAIYADYHNPNDFSASKHVCADPGRLRELYKQQKSVPGYRNLLKKNLTIFGTLDDHDYGCNNGDITYQHRYESGNEFVNFLGLPLDSPMSRRAQDGLGVYGVKLFDFSRPEGQQEVPDDEAMIDPDVLDWGNSTGFSYMPTYSNQSVAVFVLDVRSNKSPWKEGSAAYIADYEGDFLGEHQWQWFEHAIRRSRAAVNVVVSGLQFHASIFPDPNIAEAWSKFPRAQQRLFDAILQDGVHAPMLISGDVHMTQLMRKDCERMDGRSPRRSLIEITTSGMTHSWGTLSSPPLSNPRQKPTLYEQYERFVRWSTMHVMHTVSPWTDLLMSKPATADGMYPNGGQDGAKQGLQYSLEKNFGELEFDWDQRTVTMRSLGEQREAPPLLSASWTLDQLSGNGDIPGSLLTSQDFVEDANTNLARAAHGGEWICINHRGSTSFFHHIIGHVWAVFGLGMVLPFPLLIPCLLCFLMFRKSNRNRYQSSDQEV